MYVSWKKIFADFGPKSDVFVGNSLVDMYEDGFNWRCAKVLWENMSVPWVPGTHYTKINPTKRPSQHLYVSSKTSPPREAGSHATIWFKHVAAPLPLPSWDASFYAAMWLKLILAPLVPPPLEAGSRAATWLHVGGRTPAPPPRIRIPVLPRGFMHVVTPRLRLLVEGGSCVTAWLQGHPRSIITVGM
jgi:hypothetical protein